MSKDKQRTDKNPPPPPEVDKTGRVTSLTLDGNANISEPSGKDPVEVGQNMGKDPIAALGANVVPVSDEALKELVRRALLNLGSDKRKREEVKKGTKGVKNPHKKVRIHEMSESDSDTELITPSDDNSDAENDLVEDFLASEEEPSTPLDEGGEEDWLEELCGEIKPVDKTAPPIAQNLSDITDKIYKQKLNGEQVKKLLDGDVGNRPENVAMLQALRVNSAIWGKMRAYTREHDVKLMKIQENVVKSSAAAVKVVDGLAKLKSDINSPSMKATVKSLTRMALESLQFSSLAFHSIARKRRLDLKKDLNAHYGTLCSAVPEEEEELLFGKDLNGRIKDINEAAKLGKDLEAQNRGYHKGHRCEQFVFSPTVIDSKLKQTKVPSDNISSFWRKLTCELTAYSPSPSRSQAAEEGKGEAISPSARQPTQRGPIPKLPQAARPIPKKPQPEEKDVNGKEDASHQPPMERVCHATQENTTAGSKSELIDAAFNNLDIGQKTRTLLLASWRSGTHKQYNSYLRQWRNFCSKRGKNHLQADLNAVLDYLAHLFHSGLKYSAVNTARSALSTFLQIQGKPIGQHPMVIRLLKGIFNTRPTLPKHTDIWDPDKILQMMQKWGPVKLLKLQKLTLKTVALMWLLTGQRGQSLYYMDLRNLSLTPHKIKIEFGDLLKTSRPGFHQEGLQILAYAPDRRLCLVTTITEYIKRTKKLRKTNQLFITTQKPHNAATKNSIARWVKLVMQMAGIDITQFTPHSVRSASTSAALKTGVPLSTILATAGWSGCSTFAKYYNKPINKQPHTGFAKALQDRCAKGKS